ncbi:hypothetical protein CR513_53609, partial [Mucuna pruriens]
MATPNSNVLFIDTNLDTHFALLVSDLDTVSHLKQRIQLEHSLCFPKIGHIQIHGIKVKRKGYFYHLSDSMPVKSAFSGFNKNWFLSVDASVLGESAQNEQLFSHGSPNRVACLGIASNALIGIGDNAISFPSKRVSGFDNFKLPQLENRLVENEAIPVASPCVSEHTGKGGLKNLDTGVTPSSVNNTGIPLPGSVPETEDRCFVNRKLLPSLNIECEVDGSGKDIKDDRDVCEENPLMSVPSAKKKRKSKRKKEDTVWGDSSKDDFASVDNPLSFPSKRASGVNNELPGSPIECEVDGTNKGIKDACIVREEGNCKSVSNVKKKQKSRRKKEDTLRDDTSKENDASVIGSVIIQQDIEVVANPSENAGKEVIKETEVLKEHQHTDCNNNNTNNDIDTAASMKEASESGPATNKKNRKRKRPLTVDSKQMFKVETASQKDEVQKLDEAHKERKKSKDRFELMNEKSRDDVEHKHNKVTEDTGPPAKKKKKGKEKSGEKSLSKAKLINDFNVDNASHHVLEDQQKITNSNADQSADTDPLRTSVQGRRRKGKISSSNPHETPVVTSSRKDEEADHSSIQRGGVQEEISEEGLFSKDIRMSKASIDNMETVTDACREGIQSTEIRTGNYKNHSDIEVKAHTSDVDEPMELTEDNGNAVLDQCHKNEAGKIEGAEEGKEVSPQNDPELMLLENSTSSNQDNADANIRELNVTSKVLEANGMTEPVKSEKEKRGTRKAKNSDERPTNCDPMSGNADTEENPLNQTEGEKIQQEEIQGTSDKEDDFSADNAGSLEQIKTKSNVEHTYKRYRKKSNNKQISTSKSVSNMLAEDQVLDSKKPSPSPDSGTHAKPSVAATKKSKSTSRKSTNKSSKTNLELVKDSVGLEPSESQFNSGSKDAARHSTHSPGEIDESDNLQAPSKTLKVNADRQFSSWKQHDEANLSDDMLVDKMNETDRTDIETMAGKNMHGLEATIGHTHAEDLSSSGKLLSKEELDVRMHPGKNLHRTRQDLKLSGRSDRAASLIGENRKAHVNASGKTMDLEKQREHFPVSNSKLEGSIKMVQNKARKASGNSVHGVVSKIQQKRSLLAGAIFKDDSSSTSEDGDGVGNSDASTRTPSDTPLLSDFSDGDSSSGLDSQVDGSYGGKNLENGGRSSLKANWSGTKGMSIDHVLRSSSTFKKARTTASQLEETESQPEFVPDSLAE